MCICPAYQHTYTRNVHWYNGVRMHKGHADGCERVFLARGGDVQGFLRPENLPTFLVARAKSVQARNFGGEAATHSAVKEEEKERKRERERIVNLASGVRHSTRMGESNDARFEARTNDLQALSVREWRRGRRGTVRNRFVYQHVPN